MADGSKREDPGGAAFVDCLHRFSWRRSLPVTLQTEATECGLASLVMIANYYGHDVDLPSLRRRFPNSLRGTTLAQLVDMATSLGLRSRALRLELEHLRQLKLPCILHWNLDHFVVLKRVGARSIIIHDPANGSRKVSLRQVSDCFSGVALELTPTSEFKPETKRMEIPLRALVGRVQGLVPALLQILFLVLSLEVLTLVTPFYLQWVLDQVVVSADNDLLTLLGAGFLCVAFFSALVTAARSWAVIAVGASVGVQWADNLFSHLVQLPMSWFERRHVGDVTSRFSSLQSIQKTLTTQFIESVLDGLMAMVALGIMAFYSAPLTLIVFSLLCAYVIARWGFFRLQRGANEEQIFFGSKQQSELLESIRGAMPIKLANKQVERSGRFVNATVAATNGDVKVQRLNALAMLCNQLLFGCGRVAMIWIAASLVIKGRMSVGMIVAFIAYVDQFITRASALVDKVSDFKMLHLHVERVADIALSDEERYLEATWEGSSLRPTIEFRNVSIRYGDDAPWIIKDCNFVIRAGESVAITGASGCGKTTLAKVMLGLLEPDAGEVLFGGVNIQRIGLRRYREQLAAVMQDDQLFAGSIAANISFFDPHGDLSKVEEAAHSAAIHDDIVSMPMGYQTLVGDMGSSLSGGQKQRVILARALYRKPAFLLLDEATSHLDVEKERLVNIAVKNIATTCVVIAHRPETIRAMNRVIVIADGRVKEV